MKRVIRKAASKKAAGKRRAGTTVKLKFRPGFLKKMAALGIDQNVVNEAALKLFLELSKKHRPAEMALLYDAAIVAMQAAAEQSDDPADWIKAARQASCDNTCKRT